MADGLAGPVSQSSAVKPTLPMGFVTSSRGPWGQRGRVISASDLRSGGGRHQPVSRAAFFPPPSSSLSRARAQMYTGRSRDVDWWLEWEKTRQYYCEVRVSSLPLFQSERLVCQTREQTRLVAP
ncbi:hypothetical protein ElyMa_003885000 [Elysia marginata]|uniref:Uncharacterized protein n=1 Tax=Elysia marginata TaxID=1093978 RepID=A0AAV4FPA8_9GAST|nr:hypothetical protein ElyMa_003885000 [Elysia marginata]